MDYLHVDIAVGYDDKSLLLLALGSDYQLSDAIESSITEEDLQQLHAEAMYALAKRITDEFEWPSYEEKAKAALDALEWMKDNPSWLQKDSIRKLAEMWAGPNDLKTIKKPKKRCRNCKYWSLKEGDKNGQCIWFHVGFSDGCRGYPFTGPNFGCRAFKQCKEE